MGKVTVIKKSLVKKNPATAKGTLVKKPTMTKKGEKGC